MSPNAPSPGFPEPHWGREATPGLFAPAYAFAATRLGSRVIRLLVPLDRRLLKLTKGKYPLFGPTTLPTLLLTTTGRKSGQPRATALNYLPFGDRLLILGSNFGQPHHPAWTSNLLAHPEARVAIGGTEVPVQAALLEGPDRDDGLRRFLAYPMYRSYLSRTDRDLRLFALARD